MRTDDGFHNWLEEFSLNRENFEKGNDVPIGEESIVRDRKFDGFVLGKIFCNLVAALLICIRFPPFCLL